MKKKEPTLKNDNKDSIRHRKCRCRILKFPEDEIQRDIVKALLAIRKHDGKYDF